jgi:hypothetical protein
MRKYLCLVALCRLYQIGHSIQQDDRRVEGWTHLLARLVHRAERAAFLETIVPRSTALALTDITPTLFSIAARVSLLDLDGMVSEIGLYPQPKLGFVHSATMLKHSFPPLPSADPLASAPRVGRRVDPRHQTCRCSRHQHLGGQRHILPILPWTTADLDNSIPARELARGFKAVLLAITRRIRRGSAAEDTITTVRLQYTRPQMLPMVIFLTLEAYSVPPAQS